MDFFSSDELQGLNLTKNKHNHVAMAKYGGPIAVLNKEGIEGFIANDFICIFDSAGKM